ncbi:hypothetical protein CDL12_16288 [Handroanthus impetiginosus]|uniref:C2H2-type domain-containing protein n=1 Tax=Handroanthus impetiginosus TaxID=429701 RepID=A0A2G9H0S5_9LAMI|nr:hypothetical protein CDL12_16288 [Handroanthus impetiginosus]
MESNYHEDQSMNSSDDQEIDQENNDLGVGRSYECVFCKRGFNTAQALGGHMNIHRKDRARKKPTTSNHSNKHEEIYTGPRFYQQIPTSNYCNNNIQVSSAGGYHLDQSHNYDRQAANLSYATYFPASSSVTRSDESDRDPPQPLDQVSRGDWSMSVGLELSQRIMEDLDKKRQVMSQKEEMDLELRLGYD